MINYFSQVIRSQRVEKISALIKLTGCLLYCNSIAYHTLRMVGC